MTMIYLRIFCALVLTAVLSHGYVGAHTMGHESGKAEAPQCAQYCAHHVCELLGVPLTLRQVSQMLPAKPHGESMLEIKRFLEQAGFDCLGKKTTFSDLCAEAFPVIAHMITTTRRNRHLPHWVVVERADAREVKLFEGFGFQVVLPTETFTKEWDGNILRVTRPEKPRRPSFAARSGEGHAWLQFDTLFIDAGDISQSADGHLFVFPFVNKGRNDLHLLKVKPDCKCAAVEGNKQRIIPPGGRGEIVIQYTFETNRGRFLKSAMVHSDDPYFPFIKLTLAGNGLQEVRISPVRLRFSEVPQGENAVAVCFLTYTGDSVFEIKGVRVPSSELQISTEPVSPELVQVLDPGAGRVLPSECQNRFMVSGTVHTNGLELGPKNYTIEVLTNLKDTPKLSIPVSLCVVPRVSAIPSRLFLGELSEHSTVRQRIELKSRQEEGFMIEYVDLGNTGLQCKYSSSVSSSIQTLVFEGLIKDRSQLERASICVGLRDSKSQTSTQLEIPVSGLFYERGDAREY